MPPLVKYSSSGNEYSFLVTPKLVKVSGRWFPSSGAISVTSRDGKGMEYGEEILFEAAIKSPAAYSRKRGIFAVAVIREKDTLVRLQANTAQPFMKFAYGIKKILSDRIENIFPVPVRYFISALILGDRQNISREWNKVFVNTQTIHLLAISGLHVGIILFIALFLAGLFGLPRNAKYLAAIFLILFYSVMVGWMPSAARSAVMGVIVLSSCIVKRNADIYNSLGLAACIILIFRPGQLFDMGFILSFGSVLALVYIYPKLNTVFKLNTIDRRKKSGVVLHYIAALFSASLAVWFGLFPVIMYFFGLVSVVSIIVNVLAIPCMFMIIPMAISAIIFQPFSFLCGAFKEATEFFLTILLSFLDFCSKIPFAYFNSAKVSILVILFYYFILIAVCERKVPEQNL